MGQVQGTPNRTGHYYDCLTGSNQYPIGMYQCVSQLTDGDVSTYPAYSLGTSYAPNGQGVKATGTGTLGTSVIDRVLGVTDSSAYHDTQVAYRTGPGTAWFMANAAITRGAAVLFTANAQNKDNAAPVLNISEMRLPVDPRFNFTYSLAMVGATSPTVATTGANNLNVYYVGYALTAATAQYQLVLVDMFLAPFYS